MDKFVYADNAATTPVTKEVLDEMLPYFCDKYGNPSSIYSKGREAHEAIDIARKRVADALGADEHEIFFTSGGSEADNWAIRGIAHANVKKGKHLITTKFEHHAVLHTMKALEKEGFEVTYLDVNSNGIVKPSDLEAAIRPDTTLVSIMYANNEIGTIQPIPELAKICSDKGVVFHTDAVQAVGHIPINVKEEHIDLLSLSAHKFHGPKGVGALYIRKGLRFPNLIEGGAQEKNRRAGTENVPGIVGLGKAIELACASMDENAKKVIKLRDKLIDGILKIPYTRLNGDRTKRLPGNVNVSIEGIEGESLLLLLDMNGICASSGSACTSGSLDPSHVLLAIGLKHEVAHGSLRFSLSELNTEEDIDYILEKLPPIVERLRAMSPVWENMMKNK
ncbi:Cysteine desulfurase [[Clostridium] cellulosi]|uniref:Cysteine desulfurase IscS n=1 Tax=[Clostridium] cellulosi TaxID=29343 RepID=A0A078KJL1_9FIRM|nr:MAG: cysteine desulfurase NifS [[Clostridium] cellulosi]CDZ23816.1 Cysteine desulfurase [[Clostridium] cellulosi]